jgi:ribonuclease D
LTPHCNQAGLWQRIQNEHARDADQSVVKRASLATWEKANVQFTKRLRNFIMEQAQLIQAAASIAGGMAAAHYDKFSGLVASRVTEIAETAVRIAKAIEIEARKQP